MKHARWDYNRIQDPLNLIPEDEPVFLLRGQDVLAPDTIRHWAKLAKEKDVNPKVVELANAWANIVELWQYFNTSKIPDMPTSEAPTEETTKKPLEIAPMLIKIEAVRHKVVIPETATPLSAGVDLRVNMTPVLGSDTPFAEEFKTLMRMIYPTYNFKTRIIKGEVHLAPGERCLIPTGFKMEIPMGYEAQIRPRSGLALKHGITLMNTPGTIDADYRGEVGIILLNTGTHTFVIQEGDRIAQMVIGKHEHVCYNFADNLTETQRGEGGYGHTGK